MTLMFLYISMTLSLSNVMLIVDPPVLSILSHMGSKYKSIISVVILNLFL